MLKFTCPAHREIILVDNSHGEAPEEWDDAVPADCAKWLAKITNGAEAQIVEPDIDRCTGDGGVGIVREDYDVVGSVDVTNMLVLRTVSNPNPMLCYGLYRLRDILHVWFMQDQAGMGPGFAPLHYEMRIEGWQ